MYVWVCYLMFSATAEDESGIRDRLRVHQLRSPIIPSFIRITDNPSLAMAYSPTSHSVVGTEQNPQVGQSCSALQCSAT